MSSISTTGQVTAGQEIRQPRLQKDFDNGIRPRGNWHNVGGNERIVTGGLALGTLVLGLKSHGILSKLLLLGLGGVLAHRAITGRCGLYSALGLSTAQRHPAQPEDYFQRGIHVEKSQIVKATPEKLYKFWRDFANLPRIMQHIKSVEVLSATRSRWTAAAPLYASVFWEAEIIHDVPNELISWNSVDGSDVESAGTVLFEPRGQETEVRVVLDYIPPAGRIGAMVAKWFGESPEQTIGEDLCRFKLLMEAGDSQGQPMAATPSGVRI